MKAFTTASADVILYRVQMSKNRDTESKMVSIPTPCTFLQIIFTYSCLSKMRVWILEGLRLACTRARGPRRQGRGNTQPFQTLTETQGTVQGFRVKEELGCVLFPRHCDAENTQLSPSLTRKPCTYI